MNIWPAIIEQDFVYIEVGLGEFFSMWELFSMPVSIFIGSAKPCVLSIWKLAENFDPDDPDCDKAYPDRVIRKSVLELVL